VAEIPSRATSVAVHGAERAEYAVGCASFTLRAARQLGSKRAASQETRCWRRPDSNCRSPVTMNSAAALPRERRRAVQRNFFCSANHSMEPFAYGRGQRAENFPECRAFLAHRRAPTFRTLLHIRAVRRSAKNALHYATLTAARRKHKM
jgi:hypothetical protein